MAITKLLRIKESKSSRDVGSGLKRCINYICNHEKTNNYRNISGNAGGVPEFIYGEMKENKISWNKEHGTQGFHYVISFSPNEDVSADTALQIATEFCQTLLNDEHIFVCAAHNDTDHMHVHICFDSVNFRSGKMFHSGQYDWLGRIQPITDSICAKYGLSTLSFDPTKERKSMFHQEWEDVKQSGIKSNVSWNDIIRDDIDDALACSSTWEEFLSTLQSNHYELNDGKYLSLKPKDKDKAIRSIRLGPGYSKEELQSRIGNVTKMQSEGITYKTYGNAAPICRAIRTCSKYNYSPMQRIFYIRWFRLSHIRHPQFTSSWKYKKDVVELNKLSEQSIYLFEHDITSINDIEDKLKELTKVRGKDAAKERKICNGILTNYHKASDVHDIMNDSSALKVNLLNEQSVYQIHINKVLFSEVNFDEETFTVKIPGTEEYVRLYSDDSRLYNNNGMISSYIYEPAIYSIEDANGQHLHDITGEVLKDKFKSKKIERTDHQTWKKK